MTRVSGAEWLPRGVIGKGLPETPQLRGPSKPAPVINPDMHPTETRLVNTTVAPMSRSVEGGWGVVDLHLVHNNKQKTY